MKLRRIEELIKLLENSVVSEIEITDFFGRKVRISKSTNDKKASAPASIVEQKGEVKEDDKSAATEPNGKYVAIKSPIVGTFYRGPAPDASPYVEAGDIVKPGQVVCIVEAMKLMNEIESDVAGRISKILVKNEGPVEYNQELFLVEPL